MLCADCKYFNVRQDLSGGFGHCERWTEGYDWSVSQMRPNEAWVENDEGWGNIVGPEFGCVLFELVSKDKPVSVSLAPHTSLIKSDK